MQRMLEMGQWVLGEPLWLLGVLTIPLLIRWRRTRAPEREARVPVPGLPDALPATWRTRAIRLINPIVYIAIGLLWIAMARPQRLFEEEKVKGEGIDIFLVMDLSSSMLARDFTPDRLSVSKQMAIDFVNRRPYDRIGLVVFAAESYTQCPLTLDHSVVTSLLDGLTVGQLEDGTAIGMGLAAAVNRLKDSEAKSKVIVLLTDGDNNTGYILPATATQLAVTFGIKVYTIGVGSYGEAVSPVNITQDGKFIYQLVPVVIDEGMLKDIAGQTGGKYYRAASSEGLQAIYAEIDRLEKTTVEVEVYRRYGERYYLPLLMGLSLLVLVWVARATFLRVLPQP